MRLEYKWYAIYTKPRNEKKIAKELTKKGIENYCPLVKTLRQWSDRKKKVEVPLINSYIFVKVSEKEYYNALNTPGVVKYVTFSGKTAPIRDSQIEAIRIMLDNNLEYELRTERFKKGQEVEIAYGALSGMKGEIIEFSGKNHLLIRIENIGYSLVVNVPEIHLK